MSPSKLQINVDLTPELREALDHVLNQIGTFAQPPLLQVVMDPECKRFDGPHFKTVGAAGIDLRAMLNTKISADNIAEKEGSGVYSYRDVASGRINSIALAPGAQVMIDSGLRIHIDNPRYVGLIVPRSGLGSRGLILGNTVGLIDSDYQGPLMMCLWNRNSDSMLTIDDGDRVAQYVLTNVHQFALHEVSQFNGESERGAGGFGSTGVA